MPIRYQLIAVLIPIAFFTTAAAARAQSNDASATCSNSSKPSREVIH